MTRSSPSRKTADLPESVHHQLNMYALAASAAGVGVLALGQPGEAKVVYTPAHVVLYEHTMGSFYLDMNHAAGVINFTFFHDYSTATTGFFGSWVRMLVPGSHSDTNRIVGKGYPSALPAGAKIGPAGPFSASGDMAVAYNYHVGRSQTRFLGAWANKGKGLRNRYLGLRFAIKGKVHYGWARVTVSKFPFTAVLTGYAYETIPNKPIIAGQTKGPNVVTVQPGAVEGSLGGLALGRK
jgi:hypothetical protein